MLGIGGVGGYIGGKLARKYSGFDLAEIIFIARGENAKVIKSNGLKMITPEGEFTVHPDSLTWNPDELGLLDLVICCVKGYSLENAITRLRNCVNNETAIMPLLNGVSAAEKIKEFLPEAEVWNGCIYIISSLEAPGIVKIGELQPEIYFGAHNGGASKLTTASDILTGAGIRAELSVKIEQKVWEKFVFVSPIATITSYLDLNMGEIVKNPDHKKLLAGLIYEAAAIAERKKIGLGNDFAELTLQKCENLPYESSSSMRKDFQKGKETEIDSLTSYVVEMGKELHVPTPVYEQLYKELKNKQ